MKRSCPILYIKKKWKYEKVKKKKKKKKKQSTEPYLEDQHLVFLFPIKFEQLFLFHWKRQYKEELIHPLHLKKNEKREKVKRKKEKEIINKIT